MKIYALFPESFSDRLLELREFIDEADAARMEKLNEDQIDRLKSALDYVWPDCISLEPGWLTMFVWVFAGFAIGFGISP